MLVLLAGFPDEELTAPVQQITLPPEGATRRETEEGESAPVAGKIAPNFKLEDISGRVYELQDYAGNIVLLNFWATWCAPCRLEMPLLEETSQALANENFIVLAVNLQESVAEVEEFVNEIGLTFPVLLDSDGTVSELYRIIGYPSSIVIDSTGRIQTIHIGIISETQLQDYLLQAGLTL